MQPYSVAYLLLALVLISPSTRAQTPSECNSLHTGTFYARSATLMVDRFKYIRTENQQIEITLNTKDTSVWNLRWTSPCVYELKFMSTTDNFTPYQDSVYRSQTIEVSITESTTDYYLFEARSSTNESFLQKDTVWFAYESIAGAVPNDKAIFEIGTDIPLKNARGAKVSIDSAADGSKEMLYIFRKNDVPDSVYAIAAGTVFSIESDGEGTACIIRSGKLLYAYINVGEVQLKPNAAVKRGGLIGTINNSKNIRGENGFLLMIADDSGRFLRVEEILEKIRKKSQ